MSRQVLSYGEIADDPADSFVYEPPSVSQNKKKRKRKDARSYQHRDRQLTQSEVWDDSALIAAWDDAVQDFERHNYPDIEPISRAANIRLNEYATEDTANDSMDEEDAADKADESEAYGQSYTNGSHSAFPSSIPMPPSGGDETMRNMIMAWYFAGYYTGLYQGQQGHNALADKQQDAKKGQQSSRNVSGLKGETQATEAEAEHVDVASDGKKMDKSSNGKRHDETLHTAEDTKDDQEENIKVTQTEGVEQVEYPA